eukprot:GHVS01004416.1.p2 GENE.GHVS01004416.1~~GHVS01004416.1.p2  ORF type:complete len:143 (-),score=41.03 GHVS01004416.1:537-965(-)
MTRPSDPFVEIPLPSAIREETSDNTRPAATTAGSPAGGGTAGGGGKKKSFLPRSVFGSVSSIFSSKPHIPNINRGAKTPPPPPPPPPNILTRKCRQHQTCNNYKCIRQHQWNNNQCNRETNESNRNLNSLRLPLPWLKTVPP